MRGEPIEIENFVIDTIKHLIEVLLLKKGNNLAAVGFEPTPPKRLVPKTSALDHSATLPDASNVGPRDC